jgi:hypothetical protein
MLTGFGDMKQGKEYEKVDFTLESKEDKLGEMYECKSIVKSKS